MSILDWLTLSGEVGLLVFFIWLGFYTARLEREEVRAEVARSVAAGDDVAGDREHLHALPPREEF